jgi:hypothetical protein
MHSHRVCRLGTSAVLRTPSRRRLTRDGLDDVRACSHVSAVTTRGQAARPRQWRRWLRSAGRPAGVPRSSDSTSPRISSALVMLVQRCVVQLGILNVPNSLGMRHLPPFWLHLPGPEWVSLYGQESGGLGPVSLSDRGCLQTSHRRRASPA